MDGRWPYSQPGRDFLDVVEWVLRYVGEPHHGVAPVAQVHMQMSFINVQRDGNLKAVRDAVPRQGLVLFRTDGIMHDGCLPHDVLQWRDANAMLRGERREYAMLLARLACQSMVAVSEMRCFSPGCVMRMSCNMSMYWVTYHHM